MMQNMTIMSNEEYHELLHQISVSEYNCMYAQNVTMEYNYRLNAMKDFIWQEINLPAIEALEEAHHKEDLQWCKEVAKKYEEDFSIPYDREEELAWCEAMNDKYGDSYEDARKLAKKFHCGIQDWLTYGDYHPVIDEGFYEPSCPENMYTNYFPFHPSKLSINQPILNYTWKIDYQAKIKDRRSELFNQLLFYYHYLLIDDAWFTCDDNASDKEKHINRVVEYFYGVLTHSTLLKIQNPININDFESLIYAKENGLINDKAELCNLVWFLRVRGDNCLASCY